VDKYGNALDMDLVRLLPAEYEGFRYLQPSVLVLVLVFHYCGALLVNICLVVYIFITPVLDWSCGYGVKRLKCRYAGLHRLSPVLDRFRHRLFFSFRYRLSRTVRHTGILTFSRHNRMTVMSVVTDI
jgi:hypothetical protein